MNYEIKGGNLPVVICNLEAGEKMYNQSGSMIWMSPNMHMETSGGGMGKMFGRMLSGESIFQNIYTAEGGEGMIAFSSHFPGALIAVEITPNKPIICQKTAFLAATSGVELSVEFRKKLGAGFFGGEGFIMQKLSGNGIAFLEIDGSVVEYELQAGQKMVLDTGALAYMDATCTVDIQQIKGVKNIMFGGEGLFNTVVTGPGKIALQTMPISSFADAIIPYIPTSSK